jgi:signal transduction histidine kinase
MGYSLIQFRNAPRAFVATLGVMVLVLVGVVDWMAGPLVSLLLFYFIPVCVITWYGGLRWGIVAACAATALWAPAVYELSKEPPLLSRGALPVYWNLAVRVASLSILAVLVHACKRLTERVEVLVAERTAALESELTAQKKAEQEIRLLAAQLATAEGQERQRVAQDLHDTLGQDLSALKLSLQSLTGEGESAEDQRARLAAALEILNGMIQKTRNMTFELHPPMLDDLGLAPTLQRFAQRFGAQTGVQVAIAESGERGNMTSAHNALLFRAIKELILNAARHGQAREVIVGLHWEKQTVRIVVDDDGRGFAPGAPGEGHAGLGLAWIRERVESLGGSMVAESAPDGSGARIILTLDMQPAETQLGQAATKHEVTSHEGTRRRSPRRHDGTTKKTDK